MLRVSQNKTEAPDGTSKDILKILLAFASHSNDPIYHEAESKVLNFEDIKERNFGYCDVGKGMNYIYRWFSTLLKSNLEQSTLLYI